MGLARFQHSRFYFRRYVLVRLVLLGLLCVSSLGCQTDTGLPPVYVNPTAWQGPGIYCRAWNGAKTNDDCGIQIFIINATSRPVFACSSDNGGEDPITFRYQHGDATETWPPTGLDFSGTFYKFLEPYRGPKDHFRTINTEYLTSMIIYSRSWPLPWDYAFPVECTAELKMPFYRFEDSARHVFTIRLKQIVEKDGKRSPWEFVGYEYEAEEARK